MLIILANLWYNSWYHIQHHHLAQNLPLIITFSKNFADVIASPEFRIWNDKYESNQPWLAHSYVVTIQEVARALEKISINYSNKAVLSKGKSLLASAWDPIIVLTQKTWTLLQSGTLRHSIDNFYTPPPLCSYFQRSERIPDAKTNQQITSNHQVPTTRRNNARGSGTRGSSTQTQS